MSSDSGAALSAMIALPTSLRSANGTAVGWFQYFQNDSCISPVAGPTTSTSRSR